MGFGDVKWDLYGGYMKVYGGIWKYIGVYGWYMVHVGIRGAYGRINAPEEAGGCCL